MSHGSVTIFSIDNEHDDSTYALFCDFLVQCNISTRYKPTLGCYKGAVERSFIMPSTVFDRHVLDSEFLHKQESVMTVTGCNKAYATLKFLDGSPSVGLGSFCQVSEEVARSYDAWTFRPDIGAWFIAHRSNPDHSKEIPINPDM